MDALDVSVDLLVDIFAVDWQIRKREVPEDEERSQFLFSNIWEQVAPMNLPLSISLTEHQLRLVICFLLGHPMVTEEIDDVVRAVLILFAVVRDAVIRTRKSV